EGQRQTPASKRPRLPASEYQDYGRKLTQLAEDMAARGLRMAYHHHMGTVFETESEVDRLMANTGEAVGLLIDTGHMTYAGGDPLAVTGRPAKRINPGHCHDVRPRGLAAGRA